MGYSLGFWLEDNSTTTPTDNESKNKVELHINYWSLEAKQSCNYLDIGLRLELKDFASFQSINFHFPFEIQKENYMGSLGSVICSTDDLIELIFNERLKSSFEGVNYKDINFEGKNGEILRVYKQLEIGDEPSNLKFLVNNESKSLRIQIPKSILNETQTSFSGEDEKKIYHYLRFRLKLTPEHVKILSQNYEPQDRLVVSKFEKTEIIDFRLNELRDLPAIVCNCLNQNFVLEQIHFFLIRDIHDELKLSHAKYKRCRLLEKEVWNPYLEFKNEQAALPKQMLIYHFQKNASDELKHIDRFNAFAKFVRVKVTLWSIALFIFSVIMLGSLGSLIATIFVESRPLGIYHLFKHLIFHILIGCAILSIAFYVTYIFWKNDWEFQSPIRRRE